MIFAPPMDGQTVRRIKWQNAATISKQKSGLRSR
jgi:hypothetical protein